MLIQSLSNASINSFYATTKGLYLYKAIQSADSLAGTIIVMDIISLLECTDIKRTTDMFFSTMNVFCANSNQFYCIVSKVQ